jgi:hypothetical protein
MMGLNQAILFSVKKGRNMERNAEFYLYILDKLLLELRHLQESELKFVANLAYIFHNIPLLINSNFKGTNGDEAWEVIRARAEYFNLLHVIDAWEERAFERIASRYNTE